MIYTVLSSNLFKPASCTQNNHLVPCQSEVAQGSCVPCPAGQYQDEEGSRECNKCETNMYQVGSGVLELENAYMNRLYLYILLNLYIL